jgi:hypothetical protein
VNPHDDAWLDDVAVLALGALPAAEARRVAAHVSGCADCTREYAELRGAADALGYGAAAPLDEVQSARLKARVMRAVRGENGSAAPPARARNAALPWGLAAAAAIAALAFGLQSANLRSQVAALQSQRAQIAVLQRTVAPGSRHFAVAGGEIVTSGGRLLLALRVPAAPPGKVYQAWTLRAGAKTMTPSVTFQPDASGLAVVELPESAAGVSVVAVSVEPEGGSRAPTSKPVLVRKIS